MTHKILRLVTSLFLALAITFAGVTPARAAGPWYVAPTGNDANDCLTSTTTCATINGALNKPGFVVGDIVLVAIGTYTGLGNEVVLLDKDVTLAGGWDATFSAQSGMSTVDGQTARLGITVNSGVTANVERFTIQNGNLAGGGGGVHNDGMLTMNDSIITDNAYSGIFNAQTGIVTLTNTTIARNGSQDLCNGTAIFNQGTITVNDSTITENRVTHISCGIGSAVINFTGSDYWGTITLNNTTVSNNSPGGGLYNYGTLILNNSTVSNNTGNNSNGPGGIYNSIDGILTLNSSTITGNTTSGSGGGIFNISSGTVTMQNTIVAGNTASNTGPDCSGSIGSSGYNLIGDTSNCDFAATIGDLTNVDAKLGFLIGSPAYHPLLSDSPAIDAGNPAGCTDQDGNLLTTDQRGADRVGTCDIGAYEYTTPGAVTKLAVFSGNDQHGITTLPFSKPFQVVGIDSQGSPADGVHIDFTAPEIGPSGTFADTGTNSTSVDTDAGGIATSPIFTANNQAGAYTVSASATGAGSVTFSLEQILLPPNDPPNDYFAGTVAITSLPFNATVDITESGIEPDEPQQCVSMEKTVWYSFTPTENMIVQVDTQGSAIANNLNLYRSSGPGISDLQLTQTCTYFTNGPLTFLAEATKTYYLQVGGVNEEVGSVQINLEQVPPPLNDSFTDAESISSLPFSVTADITGATPEPNEPPGCSFYQERTAWYSFTPTESMYIRVDMQGSPSDGNVNIYQASGSGITDLGFLGCANLSQFTLSFSFLAEAGQTYYLQVGALGTIQVNLRQVFLPANDTFADAEAITSPPFSATVDITDVGIEPDEPQNCYGMNKTVWYSFSPTETMAIRAHTQGSSIGANLNVYQLYGTGISELSFLGCTTSTGSTTILAEAGQTYYIQAGNLFGQDGTIQINLNQILPVANDDFSNAVAIGALPFSDTRDTSAATSASDDPTDCSNNGSVWYQFTPPSDTTILANTFGSDYDTVLSVYTGSRGALEQVPGGCNDDTDGLQSLVAFNATGGTTYYFMIGFWFGNGNAGGGNLIFSVEEGSPPSNEVAIDIKPGSQINPINPKSTGKIPVAILSTADFNAPSEVDKASLTFGRTGDEISLVSCNKKGEDVNGDGLLDQVCYFKTKLTGFQIGDTEGLLKGQTLDGVSIEGRDSVRILK